MKKLIILMIGMFLIALGIVNAYPCSEGNSSKRNFLDGDSFEGVAQNFSPSWRTYNGEGYSIFEAPAACSFNITGNSTLWGKPCGGNVWLTTGVNNITSDVNSNITCQYKFRIKESFGTAGNTEIDFNGQQLQDEQLGIMWNKTVYAFTTASDPDDYSSVFLSELGQYYYASININHASANNNFTMYFNNASDNSSIGTLHDVWVNSGDAKVDTLFTVYVGISSKPDIEIDSWQCWNASDSSNINEATGCLGVPTPDTTPPTISDICITSPDPDDCASPYTTADKTPTFNFTTNENANCKISDLNNTWQDCSTTGSTYQVCTMPTNKTLSVGTDYAYLNCSDNSNNTAYENLTMDISDIKPPFFKYEGTNATLSEPKNGSTIQLNINVSDNIDGELHTITLAHNGTGTMTNQTFYLINGSANTNFTYNLSVIWKRGNITYQWWINDTYSNVNNSEIYYFLTRSTPPTSPTTISPLNGQFFLTANITLNITEATDSEGDTITYYYFVNGTLNSTANYNSTFNATKDGNYSLKVSAYDGTDFSSNTTIIYFMINTIIPIISNINCTNCFTDNSPNASPYITNISQPQFNFTTNEATWCAMGTKDQNYTTMGSARNCTFGEGATSHTCNVSTTDLLKVGRQDLFISCKDTENYESGASTSGALDTIYYLYNYSFSSQSIETENQTYTLWLFANTTTTKAEADLYLNGSRRTYTSRTVYSNYTKIDFTAPAPLIYTTLYNISLYWTALFNTTNEANTSTYKQLIYQIFLGNCTGNLSNATALHFVIKDEESLENVTANMNTYITFQAWKTNSSEYRNYSFAFSGNVSGYSICIYPAYANYSIDAAIEYDASTYNKRTYYLVGSLASNATSVIDLYLLKTSNATRIYMYLTDQDDDPVGNAYIKSMRYYTSSNIYRLVEMSRTNEYNGLTAQSLILNTVPYRFIIEKDGAILPPTPTGTNNLYLTTLYFTVYTLPAFLDRFNKIEDVQYLLTYNNETKVFSFTFTDSTGISTEGCLKVYQSNVLEDKIISDVCTTSSSATLTYSLPSGNLSGSYTAKAYLKIPGSVNFALLDTITAKFGEIWKQFRGQGILMSAIIVISMSAVAILTGSMAIPVIAAVVGLALVVVIGFMPVSTPILISLLIVATLISFKMKS